MRDFLARALGHEIEPEARWHLLWFFKIYFYFFFGHFHPYSCLYGLDFSPCCWRMAWGLCWWCWKTHPFSPFIFQYSASGLVMVGVHGAKSPAGTSDTRCRTVAVHKADAWSQISRKSGCCRLAAAAVIVSGSRRQSLTTLAAFSGLTLGPLQRLLMPAQRTGSLPFLKARELLHEKASIVSPSIRLHKKVSVPFHSTELATAGKPSAWREQGLVGRVRGSSARCWGGSASRAVRHHREPAYREYLACPEIWIPRGTDSSLRNMPVEGNDEKHHLSVLRRGEGGICQPCLHKSCPGFSLHERLDRKIPHTLVHSAVAARARVEVYTDPKVRPRECTL